MLYEITGYYLGSSSILPEKILGDFRELVNYLRWFSVLIIIVSFVLFASDIFIIKNLPVIVRFYAGNVLGQRLIKKEEADYLLPEAQRLCEKGAFGEAILYSVASLEIALKSKLGLPPNFGFGRLLVESADVLSAIVPREKLLEIRKLRNAAAHPSPERYVTKKEAKEVLKIVESILGGLRENL